jgi:gamma-glutamyl hercynylcysteine S-oxide hydrolase
MCRHLAYLGPPRPFGELVLDPPHSLVEQSYVPKRQKHGHVNADGFGVGWYADGDPLPARYRREIPIWADASLPSLGRVIRSGAIIAAVRCGTPGMGYGEAACAPFQADHYLFSLNGAVHRWRELADGVPADDLLGLEAPTDAVFVWLLVRQQLAAGAGLTAALATVTERAGPLTDRLNLLITNGTEVAATTWGESLFWREAGPGVLIVSEPTDDDGVEGEPAPGGALAGDEPGDDQHQPAPAGGEPAWRPVPDRHVLHATPDGVQIERL